jgi:Family of unknown function (DUF6011)
MQHETLPLDDPIMVQIRGLAAERSHKLAPDMTGTKPLTRASALMILTHLRSRPVLHRDPGTPAEHESFRATTATARRVPDGRYATPSFTGNNDLDFWRIQTPAEGKWAGFTFVSRIIGGHADVPVKDRAMRNKIFAAIRRMGIEASQLTAAQKLRQCIDCGRDLTDEASRTRGRGPVCAGRK